MVTDSLAGGDVTRQRYVRGLGSMERNGWKSAGMDGVVVDGLPLHCLNMPFMTSVGISLRASVSKKPSA